MEIEKSDDIVYPALFKCKETGEPELVKNIKQEENLIDSGRKFIHIGNLVPEIVYPAVFEDEEGYKFLFTNSGSGALLNHFKSITRYGHKNMKHLYNAKITRAD